MSFYNYIWIDREEPNLDTFHISSTEASVPKGKIAARVTLTAGEHNALINCLDWKDYQELLEHLFERGQKIVTAFN